MNLIRIESFPKESVLLTIYIECEKEKEQELSSRIKKAVEEFKSEIRYKEYEDKWDAEWAIEKERFIKFHETLEFNESNKFPIAYEFNYSSSNEEPEYIFEKGCIHERPKKKQTEEQTKYLMEKIKKDFPEIFEKT